MIFFLLATNTHDFTSGTKIQIKWPLHVQAICANLFAQIA